MRIRSTTTTESSTSQPDEAQNSGGGHNSTNLNPANMLSQYKNASLEFGSGGKNATSGQATSSSNGDETQLDISQGAHRLAKELDEFVAKELKSSSPLTPPSDASISEDAIADLQLQTARKLRQLLPTNRDLLHLVQERNWIPLLLRWLNLHNRPAVQVEALLALTNIAELCAQQSYYQHSQAQTSAAAAAAAAQAAAAAAKMASTNLASNGNPNPVPPFYSYPAPEGSASGDGASYAYPPLAVPPAPGGVPYPPLSFSQTLSPEALAAFDASLSSTIQQTKALSSASANKGNNLPGTGSNASSGLSSFPPTTLQHLLPSPSLSPPSNVSFSSALTAPPTGASSSSNAFLPPPTPVPGQGVGGSSFPQQLSASSQHLLLRHADAIPTLVSLLSSPNREVYEQAMWILGSIAAGDSTGTGSSGSNNSSTSNDGGREKSIQPRDVILDAGIMRELLRCLDAHPTNLSLQRIGSWTLSNLVEGIFQQPSHGKTGSKSTDYSSSDKIEMKTLLPVLRRLLRMGDAEVLSYTCWTLSHLCDGPSSHISAVVTTKEPNSPRGGLVPRLVELLCHSSWRVTKPALRTIGNIVCAECSDDNNHSPTTPTDYTEIILDCGAVPKLKELVTHNNREIQKEACWTLSNIAAGTVDQIQAVIDSGAIPPLVKLVSAKGTDQEVRSEACWVVLNATSCGSDSQIEILVDEGCVSVLGVLLGEASMAMMALEGLERVLQVEEARECARRESGNNADESRNPTLVGASLIERALDKHSNSAITKRARRIWKQHFVSCALCHKSFSKHRTCDATFCNECKCHVCSNCDCTIYHLSYQEELWAATEEKTEAKKNARKSKKAKKKEKQKQKKATKNEPRVTITHTVSGAPSNKQCITVRSRSTANSSDDSVSAGKLNPEILEKGGAKGSKADSDDRDKSSTQTPPISEGANLDKTDGKGNDDATGADGEQQQPPIDFVLYLQQTGSIIALAKLMDALEYGEGYNDEEFNDAELQMLRQHRVLSEPATN